MQRQSALREPLFKQHPQCPCLLLTATMADPIIGVAFERDRRMVPCHPYIERIVQKEIREDGADDPALGYASFPRDKAPIRCLHRCFQPSFDVQEHPRTVRAYAPLAATDPNRFDRRSSGYPNPEPKRGASIAAEPRRPHRVLTCRAGTHTSSNGNKAPPMAQGTA